MEIARLVSKTILILTMVAAYVILEINYQRHCSGSFTGDLFFGLFDRVLHAAKEMTSAQRARVFCGSITMLLLLLSTVLIIYGLSCAVTQPEGLKYIIKCVVAVLLLGPAGLLWERLNRWFIARG